MKKIILFLIMFLALGTMGKAAPIFMQPCGTSGLCPTTPFNEIGSSSTRWAKVWATALDVSGGIVFGGPMGGNLNMNNYNITNANTITGQTVLTLATLSNSNLTFLPHGTGKTIVGDAMTVPLSLGANNDGLLVTNELEVGGSIFSGGVVLAENRRDVPYIDFSVTNGEADGTAESIPFLIDGQFMMTVYSESDGAGGIKNKEIRTVAVRNYGTSWITPAVGLLSFTGATSATIQATNGSVTLKSDGATNKEDLKIDLETNANACTITSSTGVTNLTLGTIGLSSSGTITSTGIVNTTGGSLIVPNGTTIPATCTVGSVFLDTNSNDCIDTAAGDGAYCLCKTADTWALIVNI